MVSGGAYLKILVVQESDWVARGPHQQHHLFERLRQRGHNIRVIDFEIDWKDNSRYSPIARREVFEAPGKIYPNQTITVVRPALIRAPLLCYVSVLLFHSREIIRQIKSFKPDVILGMGILNTYIAGRLARFFGIPFVYYLIDSLHTLIPQKPLRPFGRLVESRALKLANRVLVINRKLGSYAKRVGASEFPEIITAGVDKTRFNHNVEGNEIREKLGISKNEIVLFFMGWLYEFSGLREVARRLSHDSSEVRLVVLGRGDLQEELEELARNASREKSISVLSWVPYEELPQYISAADICILPAHLNEIMQDIVPIKMYEYLACGKPVITTRLPGIMAEFGYHSGVVYVRKPADVVTHAREICRDLKRYTELSEDAIRFSESLDWQLITDRFSSVLQNLASRMH